MSTEDKPRWQYRFDNFNRAFTLLQEAIKIRETRELSQLEKEGVIQRFEYTMELAWNTMKDYLESQNVIFEKVTPRSIIKEAFAAKLLTDGQVWMDALDARNRMSHTYDFSKLEEVIEQIHDRYLTAIESLYQFLFDEIKKPPDA